MNIYIVRPKLVGCLLAAAALSISALPALAGPEAKETVVPAPPPPFNWSGFYLGLNIGGMLNNYDFNGRDFTESEGGARQGGFFEDVDTETQFYNRLDQGGGLPGGVATFFVPDHSNSDGSVMGGGQAGFQWQFGHFVLGVEGDFDRTSTSATNLFRDTSEVFFDQFEADTAFTASRRAETNWTAAAMGKAGYATGPWLFYVIGGASWCDVNTTAHDIAVTDFFFNRSPVPGPGLAPRPNQNQSDFIAEISDTNISKVDDTRLGWTVGGGIEVAAARNVTFALEYRHSDYGSETYHYRSHDGIIFPGSTSVDLDSDQVTLKMNVLLNHFFWGGDADVAGSNSDSGRGERLSFANVKGGDSKDKMVQMAPVEAFSWTGFYVGGHVGGVWNDFDFKSYETDVDVDAQETASEPFVANTPAGREPVNLPFGVVTLRTPPNSQGGGLDDNSDGGIIGGGQLGYNFQWGHFVFGLEGDFSGSDLSGSEKFNQTGVGVTSDEDFLAVVNLNTMRTVQTNWSASLRGRLGYARGPLMLYATGGLTWSDVEVFNNDSALTDFVDEEFEFQSFDRIRQKDEKVVMGGTVGGGIEWAFTKIASLGLEYRHNFYGDETFHFDGKNGPIFPAGSSVGIDGDQVTFRVNFLLGRIMKP